MSNEHIQNADKTGGNSDSADDIDRLLGSSDDSEVSALLGDGGADESGSVLIADSEEDSDPEVSASDEEEVASEADVEDEAGEVADDVVIDATYSNSAVYSKNDVAKLLSFWMEYAKLKESDREVFDSLFEQGGNPADVAFSMFTYGSDKLEAISILRQVSSIKEEALAGNAFAAVDVVEVLQDYKDSDNEYFLRSLSRTANTLSAYFNEESEAYEFRYTRRNSARDLLNMLTASVESHPKDSWDRLSHFLEMIDIIR